jgi:nucleotide-binding universal stress UspA family protein
MTNNRRILVAVDDSDASRRAVDYVAEIVGNRPGFHIGLFHVESSPGMLEWGGSEDPALEHKVESERARAYRGMEEKANEKGQALLHEFQKILKDKSIDVALQPIELDEPLSRRNIARDILRTARERDYATVVVGRHAFAGWKRFFEHHIGEEMIRHGDGITTWVVE